MPAGEPPWPSREPLFAAIWTLGPDFEPVGELMTFGAGLTIANPRTVDKNKLIAVRHLKAGNRVIPVELFRNDGGSVAARCIIADSDMPIIDGPTADEAMAAVEDVLEGLLLARAAE